MVGAAIVAPRQIAPPVFRPSSGRTRAANGARSRDRTPDSSAGCYAHLRRLAGRPRKVADVRGILLKYPGFDLDYVHQWLREFDRSLGEKLVERFDEVRQSPPQP